MTSPWLRRSPWLVAAALLLGMAALGWVSDDAYVTLRSVDLTWQGYGPVYNVDERVQAYTHPLWFGVLLISYGLTFGEAWWAAFLPSLLYTGAALACVVLTLRSAPGRALLALALLASSRAFVEYGTSGLENPLTFALLAGIVAARARLRDGAALGVVSTLAGLALVNRLDTALLVGPLWLATAWQVRHLGWARVVRAGLLALLPLLAWEAFSLVYYGVPVPNTAYAKLGAGMPLGVKLRMGLTYLTHFAVHDPTGALVLGAALVGGLLRGGARARPELAAIGLYLAYIVWIGGDFMAGRFLAAPVLLAAVVLARLPHAGSPAPDAPTEGSGVPVRTALLAAVVLIVVGQGVWAAHPQRRAQEAALVQTGPYEAVRMFGIVDERTYFRSTLGLPAVLASGGTPERVTRREGEAVAARAAQQQGPVVAMPAQAGVYGYYAGPHVRIVDLYGLGDPLIARLPMSTSATRQWAPGHFPRTYPDGYLEGRATRANTLEDPDLHAFYDELDRVVAGPVFAGSRWAALWRLNTGQLDGYVQTYAERLRASEAGGAPP